jgi:hypothetical protein
LPFALFIWVIATVLLRLASDSAWWLCALGGVGAVLFISPGPPPPKSKSTKRRKKKKKKRA